MMLLRRNHGFTIVELLIVIVVIAILAAITIIAYNGIQDRTRQSKIDSDLTLLGKAVHAARTSSGDKVFGVITNNAWTAGGCITGVSVGTDLASLPQTHACWVSYNSALNALSNASGINVRGLVDPWNRPYFIDENETASGACGHRRLYATIQRLCEIKKHEYSLHTT